MNFYTSRVLFPAIFSIFPSYSNKPTRMYRIPQLLCPLLFWATAAAAFTGDPALMQVTGTATASSSAANFPAQNVQDGDLNTSWLSANPFPNGYFSNPEQNILLGQPLSSPAGTDLRLATDGKLGTYSPQIPLVNGQARAELFFSEPKTLHLLGLRLGGLQADVVLEIWDADGGITTLQYTPQQNNATVRLTPNVENTVKISLRSEAPFFIYDLAALDQPAVEYLTIDLEQAQWIKEIRSKHWAGWGNASATALLLGTHLDSLVQVASLNPSELSVVVTELPQAIKARYVRIAHTLVPENYKKVSVFELEVYSEPAPEPPPSRTWDPHAGLYPSLSSEAGVLPSSTAPGEQNQAERVLDNDFSTAWVSSNPLPDGYVSNPRQNRLLGRNGEASNGVPVDRATDGSLGNSTLAIAPAEGESLAWYRLALPSLPIHRLGVRLASNFTEPVSIRLTRSDGSVTTRSYALGSSGHQRFVIEWDEVVEIFLSSPAAFRIQEIAAYSEPLTEYLTLDLGETKPVSWIRSRHWNGRGTALSARLLLGNSLDSLVAVTELDPNLLDFQTIQLPKPVPARYVRVEITLADENYKKAAIHEITVYDEYGIYGPAPADRPQDRSFGELFGLNTVWAWGTKKVPNLQGPDEGAQKFIRAASQARNYHNIHWDTPDPDQIPSYDPENLQVHLKWTQWEQEYSDWKNKGFTVDATYTFDRFRESDWDSPYASAEALGQAFAGTFGPGNLNLIRSAEIGNEPWDYSDSTYRRILEGMAKGMKSADPDLIVLPAALQASNPEAGNSGISKNYMGYKLSEDAAPYLDGINLHLYSYIRNEQGVRLAVHPEHPASEIRALFAGLRFRDRNLPGKEVHVTEWGWDASSANETASNSEAVSAISQAVYAVRGLLWLSRMGVDRAHWYFYANVDLESTDSERNYDRSGLTDSRNFNFQEKRSFIAAEALQNTMATLRFQEVLKEDEDAYIYLLRNEAGDDSHLVAWRPVTGDDTLAINTPFPYAFPAQDARYLSGLDPQGEAVNVAYENGALHLPLSSKPLLVSLASPAEANLRVRQEAQLLSEEEAGKVKLTLKTGTPLEHVESIALTQSLQPSDASLVWEASGERSWQAYLEHLPPGSYTTAALLRGKDGALLQTNAVTFEVNSHFSLQPNPSRGWISLRTKRSFPEPSQLSILSVDGQVLETHVLPANETMLLLNLHHLNTGLYVFKLENSGFVDRLRFLKE
ncbi:serine/threonine-protein kinase ATR [Cyclobacterium xiamenense]|uniref:Serine/threonine-protein kinase ATR n=2 Tax=Cyclobacterium xiamenense TaxID=1297121 RepID=A0A1H6T8V9_9BACT|nr:serine/threonine-protein kinase ATR [Cyclobacterium xiamenense]